jgi:hypothetical protein
MISEAMELAGAFYRTEGGTLCIRGDHPRAETVSNMVFEADQLGLGNDFQYEAVARALTFLADQYYNEFIDEKIVYNCIQEFADFYTDKYTFDLVKWLAEAPIRHVELCNQARDEMGINPGDIIEAISIGQYYAYTLAMQAVRNNWPYSYDVTELEPGHPET